MPSDGHLPRWSGNAGWQGMKTLQTPTPPGQEHPNPLTQGGTFHLGGFLVPGVVLLSCPSWGHPSRLWIPRGPFRLQPWIVPAAFVAAALRGPQRDGGTRSAALPWRSRYRGGKNGTQLGTPRSRESCSDGGRGCRDEVRRAGWDAVGGWMGGWMEVWGLQVSPLSGAETIARAPVAAADCLFKPLISPQVALSPPWSSMTSSGGREGEEEEEGGEKRFPSTAKVPERPWQQIANVTAHQPGGGCRAAPPPHGGHGGGTGLSRHGWHGGHRGVTPTDGTGVGRAVTP